MALTEESIAAPSLAPLEHRHPTVRTAVAGLGRAGLLHAATLAVLPQAELVGLADPRAAARRNARGMGLDLRPYPSVEAMLEHDTPQAVVISLEPDTRLAAALAALDAGASVLIDGMPSLTAMEAQALAKRARERQRSVVVACPLAHHPVFAAAARIVATGVPGRPSQVRASFSVSRVFNAAGHRARVQDSVDGGVLAHDASDLVFLLTAMFGVPVRASATASRLYGPHEDEIRGTLARADGREIILEASWSVPGYPRPTTVIEIEGDRGRMLASDDALELELVFPMGRWPSGVTRLGRADLPHVARYDLDGEAPSGVITEFLADAAGVAPSPTRIEACLPAARSIAALYASARANGAPIEIANAP
jgi:predicted dehydrogenase